MDEVLFYFVVGGSIVVLVAIWLKLIKDNEQLEKIIKKYTDEQIATETSYKMKPRLRVLRRT